MNSDRFSKLTLRLLRVALGLLVVGGVTPLWSSQEDDAAYQLRADLEAALKAKADDLWDEKNEQGLRFQRGSYSKRFTEVDESTYRYDGPRPAFKESAIIFFADGVEAASRSLRKVTQPAIEELIDNMFKSRIEDGQLDECPLTFKELHEIRSSFTYTLLNMLHSRVEYPKEINEKQAKADSNKSAQDHATPGNQQPI